MITWLAGYVRFASRLPVARAAEEDWIEQWQTLLVDFGIRRAVPLRVTGETGPMLCRLPRGYELLIPGPLWHELSPSERGAILRHELAHLARGDVWKSLAVRGLAYRIGSIRSPGGRCGGSTKRPNGPAIAQPRAKARPRPTPALLRLGEAAGRHAAYSPAVRGRPLVARIRRLLSTRSREDSSTKKALLLTACAGFALAAVVRVELVAQEQAPVAANVAVPGAQDDATPAAEGGAKTFTILGGVATAKPAQSMGLDALVNAAGSDGMITIGPDELTARGFSVAIVKPADGERLNVRGETAMGLETLVRVRPPLPGKVVEIGKSESPEGEKLQRLGFKSKVKKDQPLVTIWNNELSEKEIELVAGYATLLLDEEELKRLKSMIDRGPWPRKPFTMRRGRSRSTRSQSRKASRLFSAGGLATT